MGHLHLWKVLIAIDLYGAKSHRTDITIENTHEHQLTDSGLIKTLLTINKSIATVVNRGTPSPYLSDTYANVLTDKLRTVPSPYCGIGFELLHSTFR